MADNKDFAVFEVFSQKTPTSQFVQQYSLLAPNHEVALAMARENFLRRDTCYNIMVVKREDMHVLPSEERWALERMDNKDYRTTKGYAELQARWRHHKEQYEKKQAANK
ncbi:1,2-phenylacetyl-CoA epoxidase subunit B [Effusibacillus lacus]|uniref:Phenylacetate-CoA oxygenase n=1 Tax=Effusibacillus lacus TaxID=1348429 RepID=A0A292YK36_9BACL|nr:1,2-phenylacetyl-CoA epoxidase subunit B [Effusibacillus lacus]TCS72803.1 ring-1,2-phenylacetyl-CoA epoxidase subunit PaaB [Effusibacillus lacus]GAX89269.1 phenylacetate-CoA oxygenase [Effusibacillus lacus]